MPQHHTKVTPTASGDQQVLKGSVAHACARRLSNVKFLDRLGSPSSLPPAGFNKQHPQVRIGSPRHLQACTFSAENGLHHDVDQREYLSVLDYVGGAQ